MTKEVPAPFGLRMNTDKTEPLACIHGKGKNAPKEKFRNAAGNMRGDECHAVDDGSSFKCVGQLVNHTGTQTAEVQKRLALAGSCFRRNKARCFTNRNITNKTKGQAFNAMAISALTYSCEPRCPPPTAILKRGRFITKCLKAMHGPGPDDHTRYEDPRKAFNVENIETAIRRGGGKVGP